MTREPENRYTSKVRFLNAKRELTVVEVLEEALARAKSGQFKSVIVAAERTEEAQKDLNRSWIYLDHDKDQKRSDTLYLLKAFEHWLLSD